MHNIIFRSLALGAFTIATLTTPSNAQNDPCANASVAERICCLGTDCGVGLEGWHCHSVSTEGVQCWDNRNVFLGCELITEFRINPFTGAGDITAIPCDVAGANGAVTDQLLDSVGGYSDFRSQISNRDLREPESEREDSESAATFSEMTTSIEVNDWTFRGISGKTPGVRLGWSRQSEAGRLLGISASYQNANPDFGTSSRLLTAQLNYSHTLRDTWTWSVSGTFSDFSGVLDSTLFGGTGLLGYRKSFRNRSVVSGGTVVQLLAADNLPDNLGTAGFGLAYRFPIGSQLFMDLEGYAVSAFHGDLVLAGSGRQKVTLDKNFYTLSAMLTFYVTSRYAATLGYRLLEGVHELDSDTFTFGASTRWQ